MNRVLKLGLPIALSATPALADEVSDLKQLRSVVENEFASKIRVVAVCGASSGKSYFMQEVQKGWQDDQFSNGKFIFSVDANGKPDVMFMDAQQTLKSATVEGANVFEVFASKETGEVVWFLTYPQSGTSETYTFTSIGPEMKLLLWSQSRPSIKIDEKSGIRIGAKVAGFVARCV